MVAQIQPFLLALATRNGLRLNPAPSLYWNALHRAIDVKERLLRKGTFKWLATLPAHVRPMATARQRSTAAENAMS
jgi:hypothetical protein